MIINILISDECFYVNVYVYVVNVNVFVGW